MYILYDKIWFSLTVSTLFFVFIDVNPGRDLSMSLELYYHEQSSTFYLV